MQLLGGSTPDGPARIPTPARAGGRPGPGIRRIDPRCGWLAFLDVEKERRTPDYFPFVASKAIRLNSSTGSVFPKRDARCPEQRPEASVAVQAGELARPTAKAVEAIAAVEARREQLRGRPRRIIDECPDAFGIVPDLVVLRAGHGDDDLFGPARRLLRGRFSFTIDSPGVRSLVHLRILFPGKKKDDEDAVGSIPGTLIPAIRYSQKTSNQPSPKGGEGLPGSGQGETRSINVGRGQ
jgi:hypothetical protein